MFLGTIKTKHQGESNQTTRSKINWKKHLQFVKLSFTFPNYLLFIYFKDPSLQNYIRSRHILHLNVQPVNQLPWW